jgi:MFS transporter, DHA1 family, multidrug resistance protein
MVEFGVARPKSILGFALFFWGVAFAPVYTPHLAERLGRSVIYFASTFLFAIFTLGVGWSQTFASICVLRFFAGLCGGPCLVLIEGTFADIWSANTTNTYYAVLTTASYIGAACGECNFAGCVQTLARV